MKKALLAMAFLAMGCSANETTKPSDANVVEVFRAQSEPYTFIVVRNIGDVPAVDVEVAIAAGFWAPSRPDSLGPGDYGMIAPAGDYAVYGIRWNQ